MAKSLSKINEDTTINLFVKNTRNKFKIYYLEDKKEDTLNSLNRLVESLFVDYEASFARIYLSGKDSSFYTKNDEFGIIHMRADITHQEILPVVNVEGVVIKYKSIEAEKIYNIQTKAISLFIEKQLYQKITKIFPGILFEKEKEALNINSYDHYYLQDQVINRFSPISRTLFDYIVEINL
jgi:hypothetical protein